MRPGDKIELSILKSQELAIQHSQQRPLTFTRVKKIFSEMGFEVSQGRANNLEDFIIKPRQHFKMKSPLVVEVKSGKKHYVDRKSLRQLDDWVFELSGEDKARKGDTLNASAKAGWSYGSSVMMPKAYEHPTPHKGVMIYNGPVGVVFEERGTNCINPSDEEFANKRFFCIIPFHVLIRYSERISAEEIEPEELWEKIHKTSGLLEL